MSDFRIPNLNGAEPHSTVEPGAPTNVAPSRAQSLRDDSSELPRRAASASSPFVAGSSRRPMRPPPPSRVSADQQQHPAQARADNQPLPEIVRPLSAPPQLLNPGGPAPRPELPQVQNIALAEARMKLDAEMARMQVLAKGFKNAVELTRQ
ncbi:hypothetical protein LMG29542_06821 [Paraburkholderia humisilvae]|uniref:Uncharacterized protein n=1 Tax=Paraburkholderia humisilvae TaxID=627669 RepID=A0A6J5F3F9_9BURK|nr:hypothetical protein LMG29542_06821 [Paraburkholderia humisilvae]